MGAKFGEEKRAGQKGKVTVKRAWRLPNLAKPDWEVSVLVKNPFEF